MRAPLFVSAIAFALGIVLGWSFSSIWIGWVTTGLAVGGALKLQKQPALANAAVLIALLGVGMVRADLDQRVAPNDAQFFLTETSRPVTVRGTVISEIEEPRERYLKRAGWFKLDQLKQGKRWTPITGKVRLQLPIWGEVPLYGDKLQLSGLLRGNRLEGEFNEASWLWSEKASGFLEASSPAAVTKLSDRSSAWVFYRRLVTQARQRLQRLDRALLGPKQAALLEGLLLGEKKRIPPEVRDQFRRSGTMHLLVVSGLHVGLVAAIVLLLLAIVRLPRPVRYGLLALALILYCTLTGIRIPVLRATIMGVLFCLAAIQGVGIHSKKGSFLNTLGAASLLILAVDPRALGQLSFQLSFSAVLGLALLTPLFLGPFRESKGGWMRLIRPVAASAAAWIATTPWIAFYFQEVAPIALVANLVLIPWAALLVATGFTLYGVGLIHSGWAQPVATSFSFLADGFLQVVGWFSQVPGGHFSW